jgi:hypothetical protein
VIGAIARLVCHGGDCVASLVLSIDDAFSMDETREVAARAASAEGWLFIFGKEHCPACSRGLQAWLASGAAHGAWERGIKTAIVERAHLARLEVRS